MELPARSFCVSPYHMGPRWLLSCYFYVNRPRGRLQSYCSTCSKIAMRTENQSEHVKQYRRDYIRQYREKQRRSNGVPKRGTKLTNPRFDSKKLYAYLARWITEDERDGSTPHLRLNRVSISTSDERYLSSLRSGVTQRAPLKRIDRLATKYDLPLWELADAAGCYKEDKRTASKRRAKKAT